MICDFCSDPSPVWSFGCDTYTVPGAGYTSISAWLACETCADMIHRKAWRELAHRAVAKTTNGQLLAALTSKAEAQHAIEEMHKGFRDHCTGRSTRIVEKR